MGAFAIIRRDKRRQRLKAEMRVRASFEAQGFGEPETLDTEYARLLLYPKLAGGGPNILRQDNGHFSAYTGLLLYKDSTGKTALQHLSRLDIEHHVTPDDFSGAFAILQNNHRGLKLMLDPLGLYKVYADPEKNIISSSFLAALSTIDGPRTDPQAVYEYVFDGATHGRATPIAQILTLEPGAYRIGRVVGESHKHKLFDFTVAPQPCQFFIDQNLKLLRARMGRLTQAFGPRIDLALSGGYNDRLALALMLEAGITPRLHVFGKEADGPARIARKIAQKIAQKIAMDVGLKLIHVDRANDQDIFMPEKFAGLLQARYLELDGCPPDGIFGDPTEPADYLTGQQDGFLALDPGGGGIYRNFFRLGNRPHGSLELLWSFWSRFDPASCSGGFSESDYLKILEKKLLAAFPSHGRILSRPQIEYVYPAFYGRGRAGRDLGIRLRSGHAALFFMDDALARAGARIPHKFKEKDRFITALIKAVDPRLAAGPFATGQDLGSAAAEGLLYGLAPNFPPPVLRRLAFRLRNRYVRSVQPWYHDTSFIHAALPQGFIHMPGYFHLDKINDAAQMNRLLTLEYLFQATGAQPPA